MAALRLRMLGILRHVCNRYLRRDIQKDDSFNMDADDDRIEKERRVSASRNRSAVRNHCIFHDISRFLILYGFNTRARCYRGDCRKTKIQSKMLSWYMLLILELE